jgi:hypothetical protein
MLRFEPAEIDGPSVQTRGRSRLEPADFETQITQRVGQAFGWKIPGASARVPRKTNVDESSKKSSRGKYDGLTQESPPRPWYQPPDLALDHVQGGHLALFQ